MWIEEGKGESRQSVLSVCSAEGPHVREDFVGRALDC